MVFEDPGAAAEVAADVAADVTADLAAQVSEVMANVSEVDLGAAPLLDLDGQLLYRAVAGDLDLQRLARIFAARRGSGRGRNDALAVGAGARCHRPGCRLSPPLSVSTPATGRRVLRAPKCARNSGVISRRRIPR